MGGIDHEKHLHQNLYIYLFIIFSNFFVPSTIPPPHRQKLIGQLGGVINLPTIRMYFTHKSWAYEEGYSRP